MTKKILLISILVYCTSVFAQDTLFQCDFTVNPYHFDKKSNIGTETTYETSRNLIPSLTLSFPIHERFSYSFGLRFYEGGYESYFNDSTYRIIDPVNPVLSGHGGSYIYHVNSLGTELSFFACLNYNLFYNKSISTSISLGLNAVVWNKTYQYWEFYPKSDSNYSMTNTRHFNSPLNRHVYTPNLKLTFKYFPLKHFGILIRPDFYFQFNYGYAKLYVGIGVCYN